MISDLGFVFNRDHQFKNTKYIIVVALEKVEKSSGSGWEGKIGYLRSHIDSKLAGFERKILGEQKMMRDDLMIRQKIMESSIQDIRNDLRLMRKSKADELQQQQNK